MMKYTNGFGTFTTEQMSILETLQEIEDVVAIAKTVAPKGEIELAITNLNEALDYIEHIRRKVEIAMKHVPESVQEKYFL
ncbi:MAG: hypothetical protein J5714_01340 [Alphaproteobacteria bacterium]|nr:hypothetical protein [Alphaproteobacteria bacterium]